MPSPTDPQQRFIDHLVATGCTPTQAARTAGYAEPAQEAYRLIRKPHIVAAIRELRGRLISAHGANVAIKTLVDIMQDATAPASARVSTGRTMLEAAGHFNKGAAEEREVPLHEMTSAQLNDFIAKAQVVIDSGGAAPMIKVIEREGADLAVV